MFLSHNQHKHTHHELELRWQHNKCMYGVPVRRAHVVVVLVVLLLLLCVMLIALWQRFDIYTVFPM